MFSLLFLFLIIVLGRLPKPYRYDFVSPKVCGKSIKVCTLTVVIKELFFFKLKLYFWRVAK